MNIVLCIDEKYIPYCSILMTSILENNKEEDLEFFVLSKSISKKWKKMLNKIVYKYNKHIYYYLVDDNLLSNCPVNGHITLAAYYRLLIPFILPNTIHKIIYLDCDMIVNSSLKELWNENLEANIIASVLEPDAEENANRLNFDPTLGYFNSGFFIMDLDLCRKYNLVSTFLHYVKTHSCLLKYWDQDILNYVLKDKKKIISLKYNLQDTYLRSDCHIPDIYRSTYREDIENPSVIHFTGNFKPWHYGCKHPYKYLYLEYLKKTNLGIHYYTFSYLKENIRWLLRGILSSIKLLRPLNHNYLKL